VGGWLAESVGFQATFAMSALSGLLVVFALHQAPRHEARKTSVVTPSLREPENVS